VSGVGIFRLTGQSYSKPKVGRFADTVYKCKWPYLNSHDGPIPYRSSRSNHLRERVGVSLRYVNMPERIVM